MANSPIKNSARVESINFNLNTLSPQKMPKSKKSIVSSTALKINSSHKRHPSIKKGISTFSKFQKVSKLLMTQNKFTKAFKNLKKSHNKFSHHNL